MIVIVGIGPFAGFGIRALPSSALVLWGLSTLAAVLVAARFRRIDAQTLWIWIVLALLVVGYFAKTFYAAQWLFEFKSLTDLNPEWSDFDKSDLLTGYQVTCAAFVLFVLGAIASLQGEPRPEEIQHGTLRPRMALAGILVIVLLLAPLRGFLGIGVMGVESEELPYGISTLIFRAQSTLIPALLLVLVWSGERRGDRLLSMLATLLLGVHLVVMAAVSASKAGLFYFAAYMLCLWIISARLTRLRQVILGAVGVAALAFFVLGADLRVLRIEGLSLADAIEALQQGSEISASARLDQGLRALFLRISGADGLWFVLGDHGYSVPLIGRWQAIWATSLRDFFTRDIVGVVWLLDFRSPGFVAALIMVLGLAGVALCVMIGPVIAALWRTLGSLPGAPALRAFFAVFLLQTLMEGIFRWQDLIAFSLAILVAVLFAIWLRGGSVAFLMRDLVTTFRTAVSGQHARGA
ncbi:MAG TPA: hypothetical protein VLW55_18440 [Burkholderiaceae bacterium]|nr:hypothetical protein [Burkholderiaceae bacterium]